MREYSIMPRHPSLTALRIALPDLDPHPKMRPNDLCWCRSGLKWKKCHKDRERLARLPISEIMEREKEFSSAPLCLHPYAGIDCGERIIAAHTVQRRIGLKAIEENGHVLSIKRSFAFTFASDGKFEPERQGVRSASTFRGFCDKHDAELFRPVEAQVWKATKENAFLLSFRAVCFETHAKLAARNMVRWQKSWGDRGYDFLEQISWQQSLEDYLAGIELGVKDSAFWKSKYDNIYKIGDYTNYHYLCLEFRPILPVVLCGAIHIEHDFSGRLLQDIGRHAASHEHLTLNITASEDASIVVFGWVGESNGPAYEFVQSFLSQPSDRLSHAILRLAFECFENTYMRESWWKSLSESVRSVIKRRATTGMPGRDHTPMSLVEDGIDLFSSSVSTNGIVV